MKTLFLFFLTLINLSLFSQIDCMDFGEYSDDYVNLVGSDDETYPPGTTFMESGHIQIVKPDGETDYLSVGGDEFTFVGDVDIDVSTLICPHKILTFSIIDGSTGISVDGELVVDEFTDFPEFYEGDGFEFTFDPDEGVTITGSFDVVSIFGSTNILADVCLECDEGADDTNCIDFYEYTDEYVAEVGSDDDTYPAGTTFIEQGDIQLIKPSGLTNYLSVSGGEFAFVGDVDIYIGDSECEYQELTFSIVPDISNGLSVDGEIVSAEGEAFPASYSGDDFEFTMDDDGNVTIIGEFNAVSLFGSTNILGDLCLECGDAPGVDCIDFNDYTDDYVNLVGSDDDTYPPGTVFMESGDLKLVKPDGETNYLSVGGDEFTFVGDVDIDVSSLICEHKVLTFSIIDGSTGISVDGELVVDEFTDFPEFYEGDGFEFTFDPAEGVTITGNFDLVSIFGSTNILSNVCLECVSTMTIAENSTIVTEMSLYPNPASNTTVLKLNNRTSDTYQLIITDLSGQIIAQQTLDKADLKAGYPINLEDLDAGIYMVFLQNAEETLTKRLIKSN